MYKQILAILLTVFIVTACGGSSDDDSGGVDSTGGGTDGGADGGTDADAEPIPVGGQTGTIFGDSASEANGIGGTFAVCPSDINGSFSSFAEDPPGSGNFCIPACSDDVDIIDDGTTDDFASFADDDGNLLTCNTTQAAPGVPITIDFFAPIEGCPEPNGCPPGSFPRVFISENAGSELAGSYTCTPWLFDQVTQLWGEDTSPAPFALTLDTGNTAELDGTPGTFSFASGVLTIEGLMTFNNVAVGAGSFSSYQSNTALIRCET